MEQHIVKVISVEKITHDVLKIVTIKPNGYTFIPGQATEVAINKPGWQEQKRPFTFTGLPDDDHLEFIIKTYPSHKGMTNELLNLKPNNELLIHDVWGAISYQGNGVFIAGGAGITPFIAILRDLEKKNQMKGNSLIFSNKTKGDIILEQYFEKILDSSFINILSNEELEGFNHGIITQDFLMANVHNLSEKFYVCGPIPMIEAVINHLTQMGVDKSNIVLEEM
ncbi:MAG TPA: flavodoxin reductase [Fulvivirga sp.]|nr:flavodoxin reductase [Fulvivirga sp.]